MEISWRRWSSARLYSKTLMPTTTGCRKPKSLLCRTKLTKSSRLFPLTEPELESEWEEVEAGESAENGPAEGKEAEEEGEIGEASKITLPDVPTSEPVEEGPATKKQKSNDEEIL
jgi:hypothetical protein